MRALCDICKLVVRVCLWESKDVSVLDVRVTRSDYVLMLCVCVFMMENCSRDYDVCCFVFICVM